MAPNRIPPVFGSDIQKFRNDTIRLNDQEGISRATTAQSQRAWDRINTHRALAEQARSQNATLDEILSPAYVVAFTPADLDDVPEIPQVVDDTVIEGEIAEGNATDHTTPNHPESDSEGSSFCIGLLSPRSTVSKASLASENSEFCIGLFSPLRPDQQDSANADPVDDRDIFKTQNENGLENFAQNMSEQAAVTEKLWHNRNERLPLAESASRCLLEMPLAHTIEVPSKEHLAGLIYLNDDERIHLFNRFLDQNAERIAAFRARQEKFEIDNPCTGKHQAIEIEYSSLWDHEEELKCLTDAILWLDALLSSFRTEIIEEDMAELKPRLKELFAAIDQRVLPKLTERGKQELRPEIEFRDDLYERMTEVSNSNLRRKQLLKRARIDVELFENLLLLAESVQHRTFSEDEFAGRDTLLKGLQRIYSTIFCTAPFARAEDDARVWDRPFEYKGEVFEHVDPSQIPQYPIMNRDPTGGVGWPGVQNTTQFNALSQKFWKAQDALKRLRQEGVQRQRTSNEDVVSGEEEQRTNKKNGDDAAVSSRPTSVSPNSSDYSLPSDISDQLERANKKPPKKEKRKGYCPLVNKPGGCPDRENCLYEIHTNEGKACNNIGTCTYGDKCAFLHEDPLTRDLRPILQNVLADEKKYRPCRYVNKKVGCTPKDPNKPCTFNHTLQGSNCEDYGRGFCPRGSLCFLRHGNRYTHSVPSSTQAPAEPTSSTSNDRPTWPTQAQQTPQKLQRYNQNPAQTDMPGLGINMNAEQLRAPQTPNWAQSQGQPFHNAGSPSNAPRGPRQQGLPVETRPVDNVQAMNGRGGEARDVKRKRGPFVEDDDSDTDGEYRKHKKGGGWSGGGRKGNGQ